MLKRLFASPDNVDRAVAFLEDFLPRQAWVLAALGPRKIEVMTFVPQTYGHAPAWIAERLKAERAIKVLTAAPARALAAVPAKSDLQGARHIGVEAEPAKLRELEAIKPAVVIKAAGKFIALWRFPGVAPIDVAEKAEAALAAHFESKALGHFIPLPAVGGVELIELHKDRFAVPADFIASPRAKAEETGARPAFKSAAHVEPEALKWLWPNVIPLGALTLLGGQPGMGKSQIACAIAATLTGGGAWPDGSRCEIGSAIICESEDDPASVIRPRLEAAGADVSRIAFGPVLDLSQELDALTAQADAMPQPVRLVVLSPAISFFGPTVNDDNTVRQRMAPLMAWAAEKGVAVLGLAHPMKQGAGDVFSGSDAYRKAARASWRVEIDPSDDEPVVKRKRRVLIAGKVNVSPDDLRLAYRIEGVTLAGGIETSRIVWLPNIEHEPQASPETGGSAKPAKRASPSRKSAAREGKPKSAASERASAWLAEALKAGPRDATSLKADAKKAGVSIRQLYATRDRLGVIIEDAAAVTQPKIWRLP